MIIWSGFGILVPLYLVVAFISVYGGVSSSFGDDYLSHHKWPLILVFAITGFASWLTGTLFHRKPAKVYIDKESGKEVSFKPSHSFFFIPMRWWFIPCLIIMIWLLFVPLKA